MDGLTHKKAWQEIDTVSTIGGEKATLPHTWYKDNDYYQGEGAYQKQFVYTNHGKRVFQIAI